MRGGGSANKKRFTCGDEKLGAYFRGTMTKGRSEARQLAHGKILTARTILNTSHYHPNPHAPNQRDPYCCTHACGPKARRLFKISFIFWALALPFFGCTKVAAKLAELKKSKPKKYKKAVFTLANQGGQRDYTKFEFLLVKWTKKKRKQRVRGWIFRDLAGYLIWRTPQGVKADAAKAEFKDLCKKKNKTYKKKVIGGVKTLRMPKLEEELTINERSKSTQKRKDMFVEAGAAKKLFKDSSKGEDNVSDDDDSDSELDTSSKEKDGPPQQPVRTHEDIVHSESNDSDESESDLDTSSEQDDGPPQQPARSHEDNVDPEDNHPPQTTPQKTPPTARTPREDGGRPQRTPQHTEDSKRDESDDSDEETDEDEEETDELTDEEEEKARRKIKNSHKGTPPHPKRETRKAEGRKQFQRFLRSLTSTRR